MGKSKVFTEEEKEFMLYNYIVLKRGVNAIGRDLGNVAGTTVQRHLKKMGVQIRNLSESMQELRGSSVNDNYFKIQSHNMAYILGLIASDGCVSKETNHWYIDLQRQDEEILGKIKEEIGFSGEVQRYTNNHGCDFSRLRICSAIMKKDLSHYGIVPQKTFNLVPPYFLNNEYYISYIRGYFDGDGCISIKYNKYDYTWFICGARQEVIKWIHDVLLNTYGIQTSIHTRPHGLKNGDSFYYINTYNVKTILKIFDTIYIPNSLHLKRKYELFKNFYDIKSKRLYSLSDKEKRYAELIQKQE